MIEQSKIIVLQALGDMSQAPKLEFLHSYLQREHYGKYRFNDLALAILEMCSDGVVTLTYDRRLRVGAGQYQEGFEK